MYAIAGVSGRTGAAVARALLDQGAPVRVIVRRADAGADWHKRGAEVAIADLGDAQALTEALRDMQGAYLLNPPRYDLADPFAVAGVVGAAMAKAVAASGVARAVVLSSVGAHQPAGTGIIASTRRLEQAFTAIATPVAFLRANYFFENWGAVVPAVTGDGVLPAFLAPLERPIPMATVADIAAAIVTLLTGPAWQGRRTVDLASFRASPLIVAAAFADAAGRPVRAVAVPREQWAGILRGAGMSREVADAFVAMYDGINEGVVVADTASERQTGATTLAAAARALLPGDGRGAQLSA